MARLVGQGPRGKMGRLETAVRRKTLQEESMHWAPDVGTKTVSCQCPPGHSHVKTQSRAQETGGLSWGLSWPPYGTTPGLTWLLHWAALWAPSPQGWHCSTFICHHLVPSLGGYQLVVWWKLGFIRPLLFYSGGDRGLLLIPADYWYHQIMIEVAVPLSAPLCKGSLNAWCPRVGFWVVLPQNMEFRRKCEWDTTRPNNGTHYFFHLPSHLKVSRPSKV